MSVLTAKRRGRMKPASFALPQQRAYPVPDAAHARDALARVAAYGSPAQQKAVRAKVHKKFPGIGKK